MDDLTTRLRNAADDTDAVENASVAYLLEEAAAEIERLRWLVMTLESAARYAEGRRVKTSAEKTCGSGTVTPAADHENDEKCAVWPTNHDAAPAARADSTHERPPNVRCQQAGESRCAASGSGSGTGETFSEAEIDALQHVVEDGRLVGLADYGRLRSLLVRLRPEWDGSDDAAESATTQPRNGAPSGCETVRSEPEPVAWAVLAKDIGATAATCSTFMEAKRLAARSADPYKAIVPLYRHPQPTLTTQQRPKEE